MDESPDLDEDVDADCGEIRLACKLAYDAAHDPSEDRPFFEDDAPVVDLPPNELRIAICRARGSAKGKDTPLKKEEEV